jgi:hypothetical protein
VTLGFVFTANSTFAVTSLGWFESNGNGLGTSDSFSDLFRYHPIAPITLEAGSDYTLAGTSGGQLDSWTVNDFVSGLTVNSAFAVASNAARFPTAQSRSIPARTFLTTSFTLAPISKGTA